MLTRVRVHCSILALMLFGLAGAITVAAQVGTTAATPTTSTTPTTTTTTAAAAVNTATTAATSTTTAAPTTTTTASGTPTTTSTATAPATTTATSTTNTIPATPPAQVVEWDVSTLYDGGIDAQAGAVAVDKHGENSGLWFVTRENNFRVVRLQPNAPTKIGAAQWTSWSLDPNGLITGGFKRLSASDDGRSVVVRTATEVQLLNTSNCGPGVVSNVSGTVCTLTVYPDSLCTNGVCASQISDLALGRDNSVYSAITFDPTQPMTSYIEKLDLNTGNALQWTVGGGAGNCVGGSNNPCLSGIAVHPTNSNLVYFSEPQADKIGELNAATNSLREWSLTSAFGFATPAQGTSPFCEQYLTPDTKSGQVPVVCQPRQLSIDSDGIIWVVTGSGHLVSLNPCSNALTLHQIPLADLNDPFGVAPDSGFVGYTASNTNKVGMLVPSAPPVYICPTTRCITPNCMQFRPMPGQGGLRDCGTAPVNVRSVVTTVTNTYNDGTYVEAQIDMNADGTMTNISTLPLGIAPHPGKAVSTFFYAVGAPMGADGSTPASVDRVGFIRLPRAQFKAHHEREDKDNHDDGSDQDDQDHDGISNQNKTSDSNSHMDRENDQLAPGQSSSYVLAAGPNTKALVATITADNLLAPVSVEIDDPNGIALALPVATPGAAVATVVPTVPGNYTVRVTNAGATPISHETDLLARELLSLP